MVVRNEAVRLPYFLKYYRDVGVDHFLVFDNASDDGTPDLLRGQNDVSLWSTTASYRDARFGLDWTTWLQFRHANGHWCLTLDADELLVYSGMDHADLRALTAFLDRSEKAAFGAMMLDLYPKVPVGDATYAAGQNPLNHLHWFDRGPYRAQRQAPMDNLWVQGGVRERYFFSDDPRKSPTLNKIPLVKWNRRFAYVNSCHSALPRRLNAAYDGPGDTRPSGALLHTKFLPVVVEKSIEDQTRQQHFARPSEFKDYYSRLAKSPDFWTPDSARYTQPEDLVRCGLMPKIEWA